MSGVAATVLLVFESVQIPLLRNDAPRVTESLVVCLSVGASRLSVTWLHPERCCWCCRAAVGAVMLLLLQCADVFFLKADICQLGLDQRKVRIKGSLYASRIARRKGRG